VRYFPPGYENATNNTNFGYGQSTTWQTQWVWTNTLSYHFELGNSHFLKVLMGQEALNTGTFRDIAAKGSDPFSQTIDFINLSTVESPTVEGNHSNGVNFSSYFGSLTYSYEDKYMATLVLRRDGSSRFGKHRRWGTFPAVSLGWRLSEEGFLQGSSFIDDLRVRLGYGEMGNSNNVDPNNQFDLFGTSLLQSSYDIGGTNSSATQGFYRSRIGNPAAGWETAVTKNIGLDVLLWGGKIDMNVDIWREDTEDLLFQFPITVQTGTDAAAPSVNVGEMHNQGVDIRIGTYGSISTGLHYEVTLIGSFLENELVSLGPGIENVPEFSSNYGGITPVLNQVGYPISSFYGYEVQGLFADQTEVDEAAVQDGAASGRFRYRDINQDGLINLEDRTVLGSPIADFTGGLSINLTYSNLELQMYGYTSIGNEIYNLSKLNTDFFDPGGRAISARVKNSWTFEHPRGNQPIFENVSNFSTNTQSNSFYIEDGSYFRMQNITLAYNVGAETIDRWGLDHMRISASVNNLFTITNYRGLDPSVGGNLDHNFGIDGGNYPITRNWTLGVNIRF